MLHMYCICMSQLKSKEIKSVTNTDYKSVLTPEVNLFIVNRINGTCVKFNQKLPIADIQSQMNGTSESFVWFLRLFHFNIIKQLYPSDIIQVKQNHVASVIILTVLH